MSAYLKEMVEVATAVSQLKYCSLTSDEVLAKLWVLLGRLDVMKYFLLLVY